MCNGRGSWDHWCGRDRAFRQLGTASRHSGGAAFR